MSDDKTHLVFVYGTLKQGHRNAHIMQQAQAELVGMAHSIHALFDMIVQPSNSAIGKYTPGVVMVIPPAQGFHIEGELYRVDDQGLAILDELEQVGTQYDRNTHEFQLNNETLVSAWMYTKISLEEQVPDASHYLRYDHDLRHVKWRHLP